MNILPAIRRNLIEPLWALRNGTPLRKYWKSVEKTQYLPVAVLKDRQWVKLKEIIEFAYRNNDYYRSTFKKCGITPEEIQSPNDIVKIPILTKKDIRENGDSLISSGFLKTKLMEAKTGGSTGKSLKLYMTEESSEMKNGCARRHDRWSGWEVGEPMAAVWGNPVRPVGLKNKILSFLLAPIICLDTMAVTKDSVVKFSDEWRRIKPTLLFGHAHSLFLLAKYVIDYDIKSITPKSIISSSMMLLPHERTVIEKTFGVKVFDRYGCEEVGLISSECEKHEGMHINIDTLFVEFIKEDGTQAKHGENGNIVITDLLNQAMPFIRYKVEDMGMPLDRACSCGRGLPLMGNVSGRVADFLIRPDGTKVAGVSLIENTLTKIPGIEQMQIIQHDLKSIELKIVAGKTFSEENRLALITYIYKIFDSNITIELNHVSEIPPETNGKYRFAISRVVE